MKSSVREYLSQIDRVIAQGPYKDDWASLSGHEVPSWYRDAKFGIFIHWGVFSVPAYSYEWYPRHMYIKGTKEYEHHVKTYGPPDQFGYKDFIPAFRAEHFNADEWLDLFQRAGARYIMPVAEHHDGFQMYNSSLSEWNAVKMGPGRDVLGELKKAAEQRGITFCASSHRAEHYWYFNGGRTIPSDVNSGNYDDFYGPAVYDDSLADPFPEATRNIYSASPTREFLEDWLARTCELVDQYRPKIIYFDWWIQNIAFKPYLKKFLAYYYNRAAEWGEQVTVDYKYNAFAYTSAVYDIERGQLNSISPRLWQNDTAIAKNSWGYTENNEYKKASDLVADLIDVVSKNGCLLLNVGPKADGTITEEERQVLCDIGDWLAVNGEGIFGSTFWKTFGEGPTEIPEGYFSDTSRAAYTSEDIRYTYKNGSVYAYVMKMPEDGVVYLKAFAYEKKRDGDLSVARVTMLGSGDEIAAERTDDFMKLTFAGGQKTEYPICFKIELE